MTVFRFSLERVLSWRAKQLEVEEARYRQCLAQVAALDHARAEMEAAGIQAELQVRGWSPLTGNDLRALAGFRTRIREKEAEIAKKRSESAQAAEAQRKIMLVAQRRCRLLERLKEKRLAEWQAAADRELEALANEAFLARW
jgi:flagellar export protein FliJ